MATPGAALPGTVVPSGSLIAPGGAQGVAGPNALSTDPNNLAVFGSDGGLYVPASSIWSTRLRSFNAIGNPNFEVAQRNVRSALVSPSGFPLLEDRWQVRSSAATGTATFQTFSIPAVSLPGTNYPITSANLRVTITAQQTTLGSSDAIYLLQNVEGPSLRPLINDVHSLSLLVRSSVANLHFGVALMNPGGTYKLTKLCTLGAANTLTLIQLPNIPVWTGAGNFVTTPGNSGYQLMIVLAAGSAFTSAGNDVWQSSGSWAAVGMDNFWANAGATFEAFFVQHEPGPLCTTLIDKPFSQNLDECLRYYCKSYDYGTIAGTASQNGQLSFTASNSFGAVFGPARFPKTMAKAPTIVTYNPVTGAANAARDAVSVNYTTSAVAGIGVSGFSNFNISPALGAAAGGLPVTFQFTADTGW